ncbi:MAG: DNA-binding protein WhiA [Candidatus Wallbacteria bacterium]|nr:DNA-binding protein WhiA [Candidatus Wallbacteria bacterium]
MAKLTQALQEEVSRLPASDPCCSRWELRALTLALGGPGGRLLGCPARLGDRLGTLGASLGFAVRATPARVRGPAVEGGRRDFTLLNVPREAAPGPLKRCCRAGVLRGSVWKGAYVNTDGHFELAAPAALLALLRRTRLPLAEGTRAGRPMLYLRDQEVIAEAVAQMGAFETMLALEDLLVTKRMRNDINRVVNCEVGNIASTSRSAALTLDAIRRLDGAEGLDALPARLREVALLRLRHPTASLRELASKARPRMTKSGMQHRIDELTRLAIELRRLDA